MSHVTTTSIACPARSLRQRRSNCDVVCGSCSPEIYNYTKPQEGELDVDPVICTRSVFVWRFNQKQFVCKAFRSCFSTRTASSPWSADSRVYYLESNAFVVSEDRELTRFKQRMQDYRDGKNVSLPKRPKVALLSGVWDMGGIRNLGGYLVHD